ncbi:histidine kinase [Pseudoclavibacter sp. RFBJ3]|uniref:sensor histidine kinase n=1 Tax=unclassified Pseudoclavibacter TaxID=2615177 RepID=UPI000CE86ABA|nr:MULTISPECIES: ATP-binding protein [unclassified Pseudoclavibacter]PPF85403.1 histidine kinase [Pseudoclavibacter sp. RFBJ5]PPF93203.1 histidine kinase [Pseudoclavibacter sp. RFBJ3]PPF99223.1 histidine kinase [Pseudoclavibacter sp. RFBH5]PPG25502.1 histidine kinase [Pseudoclavibacter sp. RFBI4]
MGRTRIGGLTALRGPRVITLVAVQFSIVAICMLTTLLVALQVQHTSIREETGERALDVAMSLAELPAVVEAVGSPDAGATLQPLADLVSESAGVDYVVITDDAGIRITHPVPERRGELVSTDPSIALGGETFVGTEVGTVGPTLRAKVPVWRDGVVVGTASVGILESSISAQLEERIWQVVPWVVGAGLFGLACAAGVSLLLGRRFDQLTVAAQEFETQRRLASALREQTHEFSNRLHVLFGLIEVDEREEALDYIRTLTPVDSLAAAPALEEMLADAPVRVRAILAAASARLCEHGGQLQVDVEIEDRAGTELAFGDDAATALSNLVRNAVDAVEAQGEQGVVRVAVEEEAGGLRIQVDDSGPGIAPGLRERITEAGFSTKTTETRDGLEIPRGVGLGLVRRLAEAHGGALVISDSELGGARFVATLPNSSTRADADSEAASTGRMDQ